QERDPDVPQAAAERARILADIGSRSTTPRVNSIAPASHPVNGYIGTVALTGGNAMSIDLRRVAYNFNPALGCAKDVIELTYGASSQTPLSISVMPKVVVRMRTLENVDVQMRSSCSSKVSVRRYVLSYTPDQDTALPRLESVKLYGRKG